MRAAAELRLPIVVPNPANAQFIKHAKTRCPRRNEGAQSGAGPAIARAPNRRMMTSSLIVTEPFWSSLYSGARIAAAASSRLPNSITIGKTQQCGCRRRVGMPHDRPSLRRRAVFAPLWLRLGVEIDPDERGRNFEITQRFDLEDIGRFLPRHEARSTSYQGCVQGYTRNSFL